jgi:hypothetical protein
VFSQCCCLHFVFCYVKGNDSWKNLHADVSCQSADWQRYVLCYKAKTKQSRLSDLFKKCVNSSLLFRLKRIALQCNWTPCTFLFIHKILFIKQNYKYYCNFHYVTIHIKIIHFTWSNAKCTKNHITEGEGWRDELVRGEALCRGKRVFLYYRNGHCDRNLVFENSRQQKIRHKPGRTPLTSYQSVAQAATYRTHYKHNRRISMRSAGFEPAIAEIK